MSLCIEERVAEIAEQYMVAYDARLQAVLEPSDRERDESRPRIIAPRAATDKQCQGLRDQSAANQRPCAGARLDGHRGAP